MNTIKKSLIIILCVFCFAYYLPKLYKDIFAKRGDYTKISYSPISKEFIKMTFPSGENRKAIYSSIDDKKTFSQVEYQKLLPFTYYSNLIKWNLFPKEFSSFEKNTALIMGAMQFSFLRPNQIKNQQIELYPLFESQSKYSALKLPEEFFRLKNGLEFINIAKNEINKEKSKEFSNALKEKGAIFPLKKAFGNANIRKTFDEGYFLIDNKDQLFHLKQGKNKALIKKIATNGLKIKYINVNENSRREFYGLVLGEDKRVYLLMYDEYEFVPLELEEFDYTRDNLVFSTNLLYRYISIEKSDKKSKEEQVVSYVTNLDYEVIAKNTYSYSNANSKLYEQIKSLLFPFELEIKKEKNTRYELVLSSFSLKAFFLNLILAFLYLIYKRNQKIDKSKILFILLGGVYVLLPLFLF